MNFSIEARLPADRPMADTEDPEALAKVSALMRSRANLSLTLDLQNRVWNGTIGPGQWEDDLLRETMIEVQATITPGGGGNSGPVVIYPIQGKGNQLSGGLQVSTRYSPSAPWQDSLVVAGEPAFVVESHYSGYQEQPLISPTAPGVRVQMITHPPERPNDNLRCGTRPRDHRRIRVPSAPRGLGSSVDLDTALEHVVVQALFQSVGVDRPSPADRVRIFELRIPEAESSDPAKFLISPN